MIKDEEIKAYISRGDHWKAKDLVSGRISNALYDTALYENYGTILLAMHDKVEAGKYLFLSGIRKVEYKEAIDLFLDRYSNANIKQMFHAFPTVVQKTDVNDYPETVIEELHEMGISADLIKSALSQRKTYPRYLKPESRLTKAGCAIVGITLFAGLIVGTVNGLISLFNFIF